MPFPNPATQFKPGQSGNPSGRPSRKKQVEALMDLIAETEGADRAIIKIWLDAIMSGDFRYFKEFLDRIDGKVPEAIALAGVDPGDGRPRRLAIRKRRRPSRNGDGPGHGGRRPRTGGDPPGGSPEGGDAPR